MKNLLESLNKIIELLSRIIQLINDEQRHKTLIEWVPVSTVALETGLTSDAVRKQLQNGDFEEGFDFRKNGARIQIHQGAIEQIQRKRRSSNG